MPSPVRFAPDPVVQLFRWWGCPLSSTQTPFPPSSSTVASCEAPHPGTAPPHADDLHPAAGARVLRRPEAERRLPLAPRPARLQHRLARRRRRLRSRLPVLLRATDTGGARRPFAAALDAVPHRPLDPRRQPRPAGREAAGTGLGYRLFTSNGVSRPEGGFALATQGIGSAVVLNVLLWLALVISIPLAGFNPAYVTVALVSVLLLLALGTLVYLLTKGQDRRGAGDPHRHEADPPSRRGAGGEGSPQRRRAHRPPRAGQAPPAHRRRLGRPQLAARRGQPVGVRRRLRPLDVADLPLRCLRRRQRARSAPAHARRPRHRRGGADPAPRRLRVVAQHRHFVGALLAPHQLLAADPRRCRHVPVAPPRRAQAPRALARRCGRSARCPPTPSRSSPARSRRPQSTSLVPAARWRRRRRNSLARPTRLAGLPSLARLPNPARLPSPAATPSLARPPCLAGAPKLAGVPPSAPEHPQAHAGSASSASQSSRPVDSTTTSSVTPYSSSKRDFLRRSPHSSSSASPRATARRAPRARAARPGCGRRPRRANGRGHRRRAAARPARSCGAAGGREPAGRRGTTGAVSNGGGSAEAAEHPHLVGVEAAQPAVLDEVGAVPVVVGPAHVLADVVQQRPELEQLPVGHRAVEAGAGARPCRRTAGVASAPTWRAWGWRQFERRQSESTDARRSARGSSPSSARSCAPIAWSDDPSRSAHSLAVSSSSPVERHERCKHGAPRPAASSARRGSMPAMLRAFVDRQRVETASRTAPRSAEPTVSWLSCRGRRRVGARRHPGEGDEGPEEPISIFGA